MFMLFFTISASAILNWQNWKNQSVAAASNSSYLWKRHITFLTNKELKLGSDLKDF